ncbi:capsid assembly scaffolding protein Gp46 family protein [Paenibacillus sp. SN-8-1]|uniref:capsid assembly scaffolding protein Gp46 family protein n=1 Tax=Paenibacillus sp. SN-8-1 TaxID=3435409 RepID=UPI003D9A556D
MEQRFRLPLNLQLFAEGDPDPTPNPEPDKTFTQADLDRIVTERLARERKKFEDEKTAAQAEAERKQREQNEEYKTLYESAQTELDRVRNEAKTAELNAIKTRLILAAGYGADQLDRVSKYVTGEDEDAIKASIDEVKADMPPKVSGVDPNPNNGPRQQPKPGGLTDAGKAQYERLKALGKFRR